MKDIHPANFTQLLKNGATQNSKKDHFPVVRLVLRGTKKQWLLTKISPKDLSQGYGLIDLGNGNVKRGVIDLNAIKKIRHKLFNKVFVDHDFIPCAPMSVYIEAAKHIGQITNDFYVLHYYDLSDFMKPK